jgi:hypothetical protein
MYCTLIDLLTLIYLLFIRCCALQGGFCVDDVQYRSRDAIGAPPGVCVYCLDGSILLGEDEP